MLIEALKHIQLQTAEETNPQSFGLLFYMQLPMSKAAREGDWFQSGRCQHFRAHRIFESFISIKSISGHTEYLGLLQAFWDASSALCLSLLQIYGQQT